MIWLCRAIGAPLTPLLTAARGVAAVMLGLMVLAILYQVLMRYGLNQAPNWTEEFARFLMLWMAALMAPSAYRWGGFVSIDMLVGVLPRRLGLVFALALLLLSGLVLWTAAYIGWSEINGFSGGFATAALYTPFTLEDGVGWHKMPRAQMMASMVVCVALLAWVNVELVLRTATQILSPNADLPTIPRSIAVSAE